jgi:hypothetical protein
MWKGSGMTEQTPSKELLDLERMGWIREPEGWIFPTAFSPQHFTYEDAVEFNKHLMDWMKK